MKDRYDGPYEVISINQNGVTYVIRSLQRASELKVHHSQLKVYRDPPDYLRTQVHRYMKDQAFPRVDEEIEGGLRPYSGYISSEDTDESGESVSCSAAPSGKMIQPRTTGGDLFCSYHAEMADYDSQDEHPRLNLPVPKTLQLEHCRNPAKYSTSEKREAERFEGGLPPRQNCK